MKRFIIIFALFTSILTVNAQGSFSVTEGQPTVVYSLPKTELSVEIEVEKTTQKPGLYYQYSERYLATNQIVLEEKTNYGIKNITVKSRAIPDSKRTYSIIPSKESNLNLLSVNEQGLLCGINVPANTTVHEYQTTVSTNKQVQQELALLPLGEEYLMAGSVAKLAEGAAKQIYRIRESRLSLLTGDLDHLPADGTSLKTMLDGLNNMERELTELFVGKKSVETQKYTLYLTPDSTVNKMVLFRLSALKGLVSADDLTGVPYFISVVPEKIKTIPSDTKNKKAQSVINTLLPATTLVTVGDGVKTLYSDKVLMPQFGVVVPFGEDIFASPKSKVYVDYQTGRLLRIEK